MIITNAQNYSQHFEDDDLYIFALGYEHRSYFLFDELQKQCPNAKQLVFAFDDYAEYPHVAQKIKEVENKKIPVHVQNYSSSNIVHEKIIEIINEYISEKESITVHIDYSSMPRSWYCKLPMLLKAVLREEDKVYFWYSEGEYPASHEEYPSAGIEAFSFFSGKPSLQIENSRVHIVALGYDVIRTQAILSITDPSYLVSCYAYDSKRQEFSENLRQINDPILARSAMSLALHVEDFEFMVSKLCDTVNELLPVGNVVLLPDGPKPLIFALSLIPDIMGKEGVTCLHIARNSTHFEPVDVTSTGNICGFLMQVKKA